MRFPCPSCPDGNEWGADGPTGRACPTCQGKAYVPGTPEEDIGFDEEGAMDDSPFCQCGNDPVEDELFCNACASCGKPLE